MEPMVRFKPAEDWMTLREIARHSAIAGSGPTGLLREAFDKAKLPAEIEVYAGTMHGWCALDSPVYNETQANRAWSRMLELFKTALV